MQARRPRIGPDMVHPQRQTALTSLVRPENMGQAKPDSFRSASKLQKSPSPSPSPPPSPSPSPPPSPSPSPPNKRPAARSRLPVPGHKPAASGVRTRPCKCTRRPYVSHITDLCCGPAARFFAGGAVFGPRLPLPAAPLRGVATIPRAGRPFDPKRASGVRPGGAILFCLNALCRCCF